MSKSKKISQQKKKKKSTKKGFLRWTESLKDAKRPERDAAVAYLLPRMALDLREFEFGVVWIHLLNLIPRRRSQYFNDLNQLIDP